MIKKMPEMRGRNGEGIGVVGGVLDLSKLRNDYIKNSAKPDFLDGTTLSVGIGEVTRGG